MKLFDKLNPFVFLLAFCVGIFICYITSPTPQIILKYPDPDDPMARYIDKESNCFKYVKKPIKCPKNKEKIIKL